MVKRPCGETLKIKRNVKLSFAGSSAFEGRVLDSLLSITCDAKGAQNLAYNGRGANRHSLTNTRKVSRNVHEPDIRATGLLHFRVQLNRPRGSTVVLWNYRKTRERRFYFAISWSKLPARSLLPCRLFNLETQG